MKPILPLTLAAVLATAAPALADAPWSAPADATAGGETVLDATIEFGSSGRSLIAWRHFDGIVSPAKGGLVSRAPDGSFGPAVEAALAAPPAVYGRGRALFLLASGRFPRVTLTAAYGSSGGIAPGARTTLARRARIVEAPVVAAREPRGEGAAAWIERTGGVSRVYLAQRRPGRPFGKPRRIAGGGVINRLQIAYGDGGDLVVAYQQARVIDGRSVRQVRARLRPAGGEFGAVQTLGPSRGLAQIDIDVAPDGRAILAYGTQDHGEEANRPFEVRAAIRRRGGRRFRATQVLDPGADKQRPTGVVQAQWAGDGAVVAWSNATGPQAGIAQSHPLRVATAGADGRFGTPAQLDDRGAVADLEARADGTLLLVWSRYPAGAAFAPDRVVAAMRDPATGAWGAPELVSNAEAVAAPDGDFDPAGGRPVVVWSGSAGPSAPTRIRVSARG